MYEFKKDWANSFSYGIERMNSICSPWFYESKDKTILLLNSQSGSRSGCLSNLQPNCSALSLKEFYDLKNQDQAKHWSWLTAKIKILQKHLQPAAAYLVEDLLWPLFSDDEEVISWYSQYRTPYDFEHIYGGQKDNPQDPMFYRYQSWLALNRRWDELRERCERILDMADRIKRDRNYLIDHRFFLALAKGDEAGMVSVLLEKTTTMNRRRRYDQEDGYANAFMVTHATLFAKLAWRNGYEIEVDTPWIPKEWLPIKPLTVYEEPWPFLKNFDIWQAFDEPYAASSPRREVYEQQLFNGNQPSQSDHL